MSYRSSSIHLLGSVAIVLWMLASVFASPTAVRHIDDPPHCDPLLIPIKVDEIGDTAVFPPDEWLDHDTQTVFQPVCPAHDSPNIPDELVTIVNATGRDHEEVWYVADEETRISNWDGFADDLGFLGIPGHEAFRIDHDVSDPAGTHHPLLFESIAFDGIWQAGELWQFVLQDYGNTLGAPADAFTSIGAGTASADIAGFIPSSGSIITQPVPEPAAIALFASMMLPALACRRRFR